MKRAGSLWVLLGLLLAWTHAAAAEEILVGRFSQGDMTGWQVKEFKGRTEYELVQDQGRTVLRASSRASASALYKEIKLEAKRHQLLRWSWKVPGTIPGGDERSKAGDDYAARVYVVFPSALFWRTLALNYIWANLLAQDQHVPNAFTANAVLLAAQSGPGRAGQWISEERNVYEDFKRVFGQEPPPMGAVALMTDTDNTGSQALAFYGDISLASLEP